MMQRWLFGLIGIGLIGVIGGSLASRWFTPAPLSVTPTPEPSPLVQPVTPSDQVVDVTSLVELNLPAGWQMVSLDTITLASELQVVATNANSQRREAAQRLAAGLADNASMLAATLNEPAPASLTLFAFARNDLLLERYLEEAQSLLQATGHQVEQALIRPGLRGDQLPVGQFYYTLGDGSGQRGLQVVTFDASATRLIVFTFTAPSTTFQQLLPQFEEIIRSTRFLPVT
jgi:hypothetical protein